MDNSSRGPITYAREVSELIGRRADWTYRHGHLLLFATVLLLVVVAYGYPFPATVRGELIISTVDPPLRLIAPRDLAVGRVWVADRDTVMDGQLLLTAPDTAVRIEHMLDLEDRLLEIDPATGLPPESFSVSPNPLPGALSAALTDYLRELGRARVRTDPPRDSGLATGQQSAVYRAYASLREGVEQWKRRHTIVSPAAGIVLLQPNLRSGHVLHRGDLAATILPLDAGNTVGRLSLPVSGSGRLEVNQKVVVRFTKYPHLEYGIVGGKINRIAAVPEGDRLTVEVIFPDGLITNRNKRLEPTPFLRGEATVITGSRSLLDLLLNPS